MSLVSMTWTGNGIKLLAEATQALGDAKGRTAFAMALNKTAGKVHTGVKRTVAKQMGTTQANVVKHGGLRRIPASAGNLVAVIDVRGGFMPLKDFKPKQTKKGASASAWGQRKLYKGTFINFSGKAGGHVFSNTGKENKVSGRKNAIEVKWGPAVPREIVRDESEAEFYRIADSQMPIEIGHAIRKLTKNAVS